MHKNQRYETRIIGGPHSPLPPQGCAGTYGLRVWNGVKPLKKDKQKQKWRKKTKKGKKMTPQGWGENLLQAYTRLCDSFKQQRLTWHSYESLWWCKIRKSTGLLLSGGHAAAHMQRYNEGGPDFSPLCPQRGSSSQSTAGEEVPLKTPKTVKKPLYLPFPW